MTKVLEITPESARRVLEHTIETAPDECCGILLGPSPTRVTEVQPAENVHDNPRTEYEIDPQALYEATERTQAGPHELVGFYHSHPRGYAAFSKTDVARGSWTGKLYLLASLAPFQFVAGRWDGERFNDVEVHVDVPE